jgi:hypothetical protein
MSETNNRSDSLPSFGLLTVNVALELVDSHHGATAVARSELVNGVRTIRVKLCQNHLIVSRACQRADTVVVRFLLGLALVEFTQFWGHSRDGASVNRELRKLAGFEPAENAFGSAYASRLAICDSMRLVDNLPIYGREPKKGPFDLFEFEVAQRSPSDIKNWRAKNGQAEILKPLPARPKTSQTPAVVVPAHDLFFEAFHATARSVLDEATFQTLVDLAKGDVTAGTDVDQP